MVKIIRIPESTMGYDEPINDFQIIIDTPYFQRLRHIKQLDLVFEIYPGATHTRFEHSIGTLHHERNILDRIEKNTGYIFDKEEKKTTQLAALTHDIGHTPYSHAAEFVLMEFGEPDHDTKNVEIIKEMEKDINNIPNIDFDLLLEIFERKNPLYKTIWGLVGADVLDYITRDANRIGRSISTDTERIETYAYFDGKEYGIETKASGSVKEHIDSYLTMYTEEYNRKAASFWKGIIRRGIYEACEQGKIKPKEVWQMTDTELECALIHSGGVAKKAYEKIRNRNESKAFLTIKLEGMSSQEETRGKPIRVFEMPENELMNIVSYFGESIDNVVKFERDVERELSLEPGSATLAEMPHLSMVKAKDVPLYNMDNGWTSLFKEINGLKEIFDMAVQRKYALRVGVSKPYTKRAFEQSDKIIEYLKSFI